MDPQDTIEQLMRMRGDVGAPDQTPAEVVDWRFPNVAETFTTREDPRQAEKDKRLDDFIQMQLMRQDAPAGSSQETINQRFPKVGWKQSDEMSPALDATPETDDEAYRAMDAIGLQHFWRNLPKMTNERGAAAWMADPRSGPPSVNIEDRRGETSARVARDILSAELSPDMSLDELTPQEYIDRVIGSMHNNDFYYGPGAENYHLTPGMAPRDFDQADFYPTRKVSR